MSCNISETLSIDTLYFQTHHVKLNLILITLQQNIFQVENAVALQQATEDAKEKAKNHVLECPMCGQKLKTQQVSREQIQNYLKNHNKKHNGQNIYYGIYILSYAFDMLNHTLLWYFLLWGFY